MAKQRSPELAPEQPLIYHIRLQGHVDPLWTSWFGNVTIVPQDNGDTVLICAVVDQAALYGLLRKVRDLGMPLLEVKHVSGPPKAAHDADDA